MRAVFPRLLATLLALAGTALGQYSLEWTRFDIFAQLDNQGAAYVRETLTAKVNGRVPVLDRRLAWSTDQAIVIRKFVREMGREEMEIADYIWRDGTLTWRIRDYDEPEWIDETLTYRLEYELRGAIAPAWDIPVGPGSFLSRENFPHFRERWRETLAAWREPAQRYRFDHDVPFARFSSEGPRELNYTFKYDTAWKHPQPDAPLRARVTPDSDYRVTELRDYLRPGPPPAVALWKPVVRVGAIVVFTVLALGLWLIYALGEIRRHGLLGPRLDREWFQENIASIPAEILARDAGTTRHGAGFPLFLARQRLRGMIEVRDGLATDEDGEPEVHLRLLGEERSLPAFEREVLAKLFPNGRESGTTELRKVYAESGFDPEDALGEALDEREESLPASAPPPQESIFWRLLGRLLVPIFGAAAALILVEACYSDYNDSLEIAMYLPGGFLGLALLICLIPMSTGGLGRALTALVPIAATLPGMLSLHFHHTLPLLPAGAAGLATLGLGCVLAWLLIRRSFDEGGTAQQRLAALGRRFVGRELQRRRPNLDDGWLLQIIALVGEGPLAKWRARGANPADDLAPLGDHRPFTGNLSLAAEEGWAEALEVFPAEQSEDVEDDDDSEEEQPPAR